MRRRWLLCLAILLCLGVRLAALDADPPAWLSWSAGLATDEGFYTLDARHETLWGTWAPGNFHDRLLSPGLSLLQQAVFAALGAGRTPARLISVIFGLLTIAVFWLGLRRAFGVPAADAGGLFLGLAPPFALYNRLALQDTPAVFWLALAWWLWTEAAAAEPVRRQRALGALAGAALLAVLLFKSLALLGAPALACACWRDRTRRSGVGWGAVAGAGVVLILYVLCWYAPHQADLARMTTYYRRHQMEPHTLRSLWLNIRRGVIGGERGLLPYGLMLLPVPCLLALRAVVRPGRLGPAGAFLGIWLGCGLLFCLVSSYTPSRYYVLFLPPLAGLAAAGLEGLGPRIRAVGVALFLLTSGVWYGRAWAERTFQMADAGRTLARLPAGSVLIGDFAPALCLDTAFPAAPVQPGLSNDDHPVERLKATHVAVARGPDWLRWWQPRYPQIIGPSHRIMVLPLGGARRFMVDVYEVRQETRFR